jgi:hypothetical protein
MEAEIRRLAVDANLHDRLGLDAPHANLASKRRRRLRQAIEALKEGDGVMGR